METKDLIAANLRTLRKVRGLSQPELAELVGTSPRTIARLEAAQVADPSINHVRSLARALGVTVDLLSESELVPITVAVPKELSELLSSPAGLSLLSELFDHEQVRARQAAELALRELAEQAR